MNRKWLRPLIYLCLIVIAAASCTKKGNDGATGPAGPTGPSGPAYKGAITGHVNVYDEYGSKKLTGLANINLTLKGGRTTETDSNGYFIFDSVSTGSYTISAEGAGLAGTMIKNIGFVSDTFYTDIAISKKPSFELISMNAYHNTGSQFDSVVISVPSDTRARNLIVFVHNSKSVSNMPGNYLLSYVKTIPALMWPGNQNVVLRIPASDFNNANIYYGEQTYFAAYSYVVNDASVYTDPITGKDVYNATGIGIVDSAIAP